MRKLLTLAVSAALLLAPAASAADPVEPPTARVQVVLGEVVPSSTLPDVYVFSGSGYIPITRVTVAVDGLDVVRIDSTGAGEFTARLTVLGDGPAVLTATGLGLDGFARVATAAVTPGQGQVRTGRGPERTGEIPTRVYTNLLAGLAVVLFLVMVVIAGQAVRRRPGTST